MSSILRQAMPSSGPIKIGGEKLDIEREASAENRLGEVFPGVSVLTQPDGSRLIPILEVYKLENIHQTARKQEYDSGYQAGYEKGKAEGLATGKAEATQVLRNFEAAIADVVGLREKMLNESRTKILELVKQISRKVTFDAVDIDPEVTLDMINGVIDTLTDRSQLKIKVNPKHLPIIEQGIEKFLQGSTSIKELTIEPDPRVRFGGCFIETPVGDIDARLESQFEIISESLDAADGAS